MTEPKEFFDAVRKGDVPAVRTMLAADGGLVDARTERGFSPVTVAAYYGRYDVLRTILEHRPTMTVHEAALAGDLKRVRDLVDRDGNTANDTSSPDGFPPLALAAYAGQAAIVEFLLSKGADVNYAAPGPGFTALTGAVSEDRPEVVDLLVKAGATVDYKYEGGEAAVLVTAAAVGNPAVVRALLDAGADANIRTKDGKTPLAMAVEKGHADVANLLRERGAEA